MKIEIEELDELARGQREIAALLKAPVVPQYDAKGKMIGAKREVPEGGAPDALPQSRISALGATMVRMSVIIRDWTLKGFAKRDERIAALEARIVALEQERGK